MKNTLAAAVLCLYAASSAGVVLVEYSCHETGTSGLTTPAPRTCYAPTCSDEAPGDVAGDIGRAADPCCDHACCDIDVRVSAPGDQMAGAKPAPDIAGNSATAAMAEPVAFERAPAAAREHPPAALFPGFDRPLRI